uniref:Uncharacterized protein n=1 Tax=viral metagenome TaxID=1070528 RepID=A0A6M3MCW8_9ZZZZ
MTTIEGALLPVSGEYVIQGSGAHVQISGQHVYVESGIWVAGLSFSGLDIQVNVSGDPVIISGQPVTISGDHVYVESGVYLASGAYVVADIAESGIGVQVQSGLHVYISGQHVYVESGAYVVVGTAIVIGSGVIQVESGLGVLISGQHVFQESGAQVIVAGYNYASGDYERLVVTPEYEDGIITPSSGIIRGADIGLLYAYDPDGLVWNRVEGANTGNGLAKLYIFGGVRVSGVVGVSGSINILSGHVAVSSGEIHILSGEVTIQSGMYFASGLYVVADIAESGMGVQIQSGAHVQISGQHVYVESGVHVVSASGTLHVVVDVGEITLKTSGVAMDIDKTVNAAVEISTPHHEIHEGNMWHSWCIKSGLADNANLDMLVVTGSGKEVHIAMDGACGGDSWLEMYEGATVSNNGNLITPNCMNRATSGVPATLTYCEPTITSTMHPLTKQFMTGGEKKDATGGIIRPNTEWIFNGISGNLNYVVRVKNVAGDAKDTSVGVEFYEKNHNPT